MDKGKSEVIADNKQPVSTADLAQAMETARASGHPVLYRVPTRHYSPNAKLLISAHGDQIQTGFVDEPRRSVEDADALVASAMKRLAEMFAFERAQLESAWDRDGNISTEDLRIALQRYRSFFGRLLTI